MRRVSTQQRIHIWFKQKQTKQRNVISSLCMYEEKREIESSSMCVCALRDLGFDIDLNQTQAAWPGTSRWFVATKTVVRVA